MRKTDYNAARDDEEIAALFREGDERAGKRKADEHAQSLDELAEIIGTPRSAEASDHRSFRKIKAKRRPDRVKASSPQKAPIPKPAPKLKRKGR
ncbi:MAG: hypothetical protein IJQ53_06845 [Clostridia bacterium]|nr:hypothetical protein [Clostridia bacterium]